jgi:ParB family chromosome partitioning protein
MVLKQRDTNNRPGRERLTSAESLVNAYRRESQKQKLMIRKAKICDAKLVFIVSAFDKLLSDEHFVTLLRAESLFSMPKYLWTKLGAKHKEAA